MKLNKRGLILINKMMSTKSFLIKTLPIVLIVFSISIAASIQTSEAISVSADKLKFDIERGDTQLLFWSVRNTDPYPVDLEFYATGPGSDLLVFEQFDTLEIKERKTFDILVSVPIDYQDNIELRPVLHVLQRSQDPNSISNSDEDARFTAVAKVNVVMKTVPIIRIGENPVYTPPVFEKEKEPESNPALEKPKTPEVIEQAETIEDKLKRIQEANEAKAPKVDDTWEESFEEEAVPDYQPEPEYELEPKDIVTPTEKTIVEEKIECDFFAMILSWFGFGKC